MKYKKYFQHYLRNFFVNVSALLCDVYGQTLLEINSKYEYVNKKKIRNRMNRLSLKNEKNYKIEMIEQKVDPFHLRALNIINFV